jgi:peptidoglycan hydrolase-like protein with peptidoglycan-binding domain
MARAIFPGNMVGNGKFYGTPLTIVQRALKRKYPNVKAKGYFGVGTQAAIKDIQRRAKLPQSGNIGGKTWGVLNGYYLNDREKAQINNYVLDQRRKAAEASAAKARGSVLDQILRAGYVMIENRGRIHYTQGPMRMQGVRRKLHLPQYPTWEDCSSSVTWLYYQAGARDPNGLGYPGYGYTGTLARNGRRVNVSDAQPGDLVFYGPGTHSHVAMVLKGRGPGARCFSHGSEAGPLYVSANYRPIAEVRRYPLAR